MVLLGIAIFLFVCGIERGFEASRKIIIKLETALKLYEKDFYTKQESILPHEYADNKKKWTDHFRTLYVIIIAVFVAIIVLTWANPCKYGSIDACAPLSPNQTQKIINE